MAYLLKSDVADRVARISAKSDCHYVYRFFDRHGTLLYIGVTYNVKVRMEQHRWDKWWWPLVTGHTAVAFRTRTDADHAEAHAIKTEGAVFNLSGRPSSESDEIRQWYRFMDAMLQAADGRQFTYADALELIESRDVPADVAAAALSSFSSLRRRDLAGREMADA